MVGFMSPRGNNNNLSTNYQSKYGTTNKCELTVFGNSYFMYLESSVHISCGYPRNANQNKAEQIQLQ